MPQPSSPSRADKGKQPACTNPVAVQPWPQPKKPVVPFQRMGMPLPINHATKPMRKCEETETARKNLRSKTTFNKCSKARWLCFVCCLPHRIFFKNLTCKNSKELCLPIFASPYFVAFLYSIGSRVRKKFDAKRQVIREIFDNFPSPGRVFHPTEVAVTLASITERSRSFFCSCLFHVCFETSFGHVWFLPKYVQWEIKRGTDSGQTMSSREKLNVKSWREKLMRKLF